MAYGDFVGVLREVLKKAISKPVTTKYPKEKTEAVEGLRGRVVWERKTCIWCRLCEINCPSKAIEIDKEKKIWSIDTAKCIFCGRCEEVCPTKPKSVTLSKEFELSTKKKETLKDIYTEN